MKVRVLIFNSKKDFDEHRAPFRNYVINHDDEKSRRVLGEQCRNAFEGGQVVVTIPLK